MSVRADIKFGLHTIFLDTTLAAEVPELPGESIEEGVIRVHEALERAADMLRKKAATQNGFMQDANYVPPPSTLTTTSNGPAVIDLSAIRERDQLEDQIIAATTIETLQSIKDQCGKSGLMGQYIAKFNHLNLGS